MKNTQIVSIVTKCMENEKWEKVCLWRAYNNLNIIIMICSFWQKLHD